jgi:hypothetical protein
LKLISNHYFAFQPMFQRDRPCNRCYPPSTAGKSLPPIAIIETPTTPTGMVVTTIAGAAGAGAGSGVLSLRNDITAETESLRHDKSRVDGFVT